MLAMDLDKSSNPGAAFIEAASSLSVKSFPPNSPDRFVALQAARALVRRLETPIETAFDIALSIPALFPALATVRANDALNALAADGGRPKTTAELCKADPAASPAKPGVEESLMRRMLRHLAAMHFVDEVGEDLWAANDLSQAMACDENYGAVRYGDIAAMHAHSTMIPFLEKNGWRDVRVNDGCWQMWKGDSKQLFFDEMMVNSELRFWFGQMMKGYSSQRTGWTEIYDTSKLFEGEGPTEKDAVVLVDVGGNVGADAVKLVKKHPELKDRVMVQDLPPVIADVKEELESQGIKTLGHDFFTEQPVKGAKAYFLHSIFHNWPDKEGKTILRGLKPAFKKGYTKLLVNDLILPPTGAGPWSTSMDLTMMAVLNARERDEAEWHRFLGSEGFKVVKFWRSPGTPEGIVEAILKE